MLHFCNLADQEECLLNRIFAMLSANELMDRVHMLKNSVGYGISNRININYQSCNVALS